MNKIAFILPSLANTGPIIVAKDIINNIVKIDPAHFYFTVFYFDDKIELDFSCETKQIITEHINDQLADFDIVHSHGYRADKFLSKNRDFINAKIISTIHCDVFQDLRHTYNYFVSVFYGKRWISYLNAMHNVITLTYQHQRFYSKYIPKQKLRVIYNGRELNNQNIDEQDRSFFEELKRNHPSSVIIGSFAGLTTRKGIDMVIRALHVLPQCLFVVIGEGKAKKNLEKLAFNLGVHDRCYFLGYRKDASRYFKEIDIFAIPSRSEAFPLALIEATLTGISSVCSNIPVLEEVFSQEEVSFFKIEEIDSLKKAIELAIREKKLKGKKAQIKAQNNYTAEIMAKNYINLYNSIS